MMGFDRDTVLTIYSMFLLGLIHLPRIYSFKQRDAFYLPALAVAKRGHGDQEQKIFFKGSEFEPETFVTQHEDVLLECVVGGSPSPTIHWLKNGIRIEQGYQNKRGDDDVDAEVQQTQPGQPMLRLGKVKSRLFIDCVSHNDEAEYTCVAETPTERIVQKTVLSISNSLPLLSKESCITKKAFRGEPARIYLWTALRLEFEGASVQLLCRSEGYPAPACSWRFGEFGKKIENNGQYQVLGNGDLVIRDVKWIDHMGDFFCQCENESGSDEISTFLYPTEP